MAAYLDLFTSARRGLFEFFRGYDNPYFNFSTRLDITKLLGLLVVSSLAFPAWQQECMAQKRPLPLAYDYATLAITSISNSAAEAAKLPDISQRVKLMVYAATLLPVSEREAAIHLLDVTLKDLKDLISQEQAPASQRREALTLRAEVLVAYARIDAEKAITLQKEHSEQAQPKQSSGEVSFKQSDWFGQLMKRRTMADQPARMAVALVDSEPERALQLAASSLQQGVVSGALCDLVKNLIQNHNRQLLNRFEKLAAALIAQNGTLDLLNLPYLADIVQSDNEMLPFARAAFVGFFIRALQNTARVVSEPGINESYLTMASTYFTLNVRPIVSQYAPEQLLTFDLLMDQIAPLVSETTRGRLKAFTPELATEPRERLNEILRTPGAQQRDLRLARFLFQLIRKKDGFTGADFELASDAIKGFTDPVTQTAFSDLLLTTQVNQLVNRNKFIEARRVAGSIASAETRCWAFLALSRAAEKDDGVLGFELITDALNVLDAASPTPVKVELALAVASMLVKSDPQRAFDILATASRYANSSVTKIDPSARPAVAFGLAARIGESQTTLGVIPESLTDLTINSSLSGLATTDWFRANQIAGDILDPYLRLQLNLQFAGAMLKAKTSTQPDPEHPARNERAARNLH
jgi:hypothetical protein